VLGEIHYNVQSHYTFYFLPKVLTSTLDGGEWSVSHPCCFTPRERAPGAPWIGGWVGPRAILDTGEEKIPSPHQELNPRTPIVQPIAQCYTNLSSLLLNPSVESMEEVFVLERDEQSYL